MLAGSLVLALVALNDELRLQTAAAEYASADTEQIIPVGAAAAAIGRQTPREALFRALTQAKAAARVSDSTIRTKRIAAARRWLALALAKRPHWGEAELALAYIDSLDAGPAAAVTQSTFAASYRDSPYLRDGALWRIGFALAQWRSLDPVVRAEVSREAAWYSYQSDDSYWEAMGLLVGTPAEPSYMRDRAAIDRRALRGGRSQDAH